MRQRPSAVACLKPQYHFVFPVNAATAGLAASTDRKNCLADVLEGMRLPALKVPPLNLNLPLSRNALGIGDVLNFAPDFWFKFGEQK